MRRKVRYSCPWCGAERASRGEIVEHARYLHGGLGRRRIRKKKEAGR